MKPNSQVSRQLERVDQDGPSSRHPSIHPLTDYHFHTPASEMQSAGGPRKLSRPVFAPGFRDLSKEFLGAETRRNYVAEALFFSIIVGVSVWPIVSMVRALAQLMK
jgi:hypothetical protein